MISSKMLPLLQNNSVIREMFEEGKCLSNLYGKENVYDFSLGNPNLKAPKEIHDAIMDILKEEDAILIHGYMNNAGFEDVRSAIAKDLNIKYQTGYHIENIIMTSGAAMGLNIILKSILNPQDEVITFAPYFVEYKNYVQNYDGKLVIIPANTKDFLPDIWEMEKAIHKKTRAIIINSPHNPTGVVYPREIFLQLQEVIARKEKELGITILTIVDEPYRELVYEGVEVVWVPHFIEHSIVVYSYSKTFSLAGERIGWVLIPDNIPESKWLIEASVIANRCLGSVNAPSLMQRVIARCLDIKPKIEFYNKNREILSRRLKELGFSFIDPKGAFYLFLKSPIKDDIEFAQICKKYRILVVPGSAFGCKGYVRIAYCVNEKVIWDALKQFEKVAMQCLNKKR